MYFESLLKAARCRKEAMTCFARGCDEIGLRWIEIGKGFVRNAAFCRAVFLKFEDRGLPK